MLWDITLAGRQPAGEPLQLALQLCQLGQPVALISRVGNDEPGHELLALSGRHGLSDELVQRSETHLTGVVKTTVRPGGEVVCRVPGPAAWDYIRHTSALRTAVGAASMLVYGSMAARHFTSRETLYRLLVEAPLKVFTMNLCRPHYHRQVVKYLLHQADVVKLTRTELLEIMSWLGWSAPPATVLPRLASHFGLQAICLTDGPSDVLLWAQHTLFVGPGLPPFSTRTGSPEAAFMAALLQGWSQARQPDECLAQASAVAWAPGRLPSEQEASQSILPDGLNAAVRK